MNSRKTNSAVQPVDHEQLNLLREKLKQSREMIRRKQAQIVELNSKIATLRDRGVDGREIDSVAHNSQAGMNGFFETIQDETPYRRFGAELRTLLYQEGVAVNAKSIGDFGVGPGIALQEVLNGRTPLSITGFDFSPVALDHARRFLPDARCEVHDILEESPGRFDLVLCSEVLEHIDSPERGMQVLLDSVAAAGTLVVTVPNGRIDHSKYHVNFWSPESWGHFIDAETRRAAPREFRVAIGVFSGVGDQRPRNNFAIIRSI